MLNHHLNYEYIITYMPLFIQMRNSVLEPSKFVKNLSSPQKDQEKPYLQSNKLSNSSSA